MQPKHVVTTALSLLSNLTADVNAAVVNQKASSQMNDRIYVLAELIGDTLADLPEDHANWMSLVDTFVATPLYLTVEPDSYDDYMLDAFLPAQLVWEDETIEEPERFERLLKLVLVELPVVIRAARRLL